MARLLSASEVSRLLSNDPRLRDRINRHNAVVATGAWDQIFYAKRDDVPIPVRGVTATDIYLGPVIVFPDAKGKLFYAYPEGARNADSLIASIQKPAYRSPDEGWNIVFDPSIPAPQDVLPWGLILGGLGFMYLAGRMR